MVPLALVLDSTGAHDPSGAAGALGAALLWLLLTVPFVAVNAVLCVRALWAATFGVPGRKALLACLILFVAVAVVLATG